MTKALAILISVSLIWTLPGPQAYAAVSKHMANTGQKLPGGPVVKFRAWLGDMSRWVGDLGTGALGLTGVPVQDLRGLELGTSLTPEGYYATPTDGEKALVAPSLAAYEALTALGRGPDQAGFSPRVPRVRMEASQVEGGASQGEVSLGEVARSVEKTRHSLQVGDMVAAQVASAEPFVGPMVLGSVVVASPHPGSADAGSLQLPERISPPIEGFARGVVQDRPVPFVTSELDLQAGGRQFKPSGSVGHLRSVVGFGRAGGSRPGGSRPGGSQRGGAPIAAIGVVLGYALLSSALLRGLLGGWSVPYEVQVLAWAGLGVFSFMAPGIVYAEKAADKYRNLLMAIPVGSLLGVSASLFVAGYLTSSPLGWWGVAPLLLAIGNLRFASLIPQLRSQIDKDEKDLLTERGFARSLFAIGLTNFLSGGFLPILSWNPLHPPGLLHTAVFVVFSLALVLSLYKLAGVFNRRLSPDELLELRLENVPEQAQRKKDISILEKFLGDNSIRRGFSGEPSLGFAQESMRAALLKAENAAKEDPFGESVRQYNDSIQAEIRWADYWLGRLRGAFEKSVWSSPMWLRLEAHRKLEKQVKSLEEEFRSKAHEIEQAARANLLKAYIDQAEKYNQAGNWEMSYFLLAKGERLLQEWNLSESEHARRLEKIRKDGLRQVTMQVEAGLPDSGSK
ncbi:MAG: hypothetical protein HY402_03315 [Elusimicrobia bacterium]|nr:hypothetical protein [Elusimicrobiota bacterium]